MSVPERRVAAVFVLVTVVLFAVGIPLGWSGETIGTTFVLFGVVAAVVGASVAPREVQHPRGGSRPQT